MPATVKPKGSRSKSKSPSVPLDLPLGASLQTQGIGFKVWVPHATAVSVLGNFNDWNPKTHPLQPDGHGNWQAVVDQAKIGDQYKYHIVNGEWSADRIDPRAREVTNSVGAGIVVDPAFDWGDNHFQLAPWNELVIYEMHVGTFFREQPDKPGTFDDVTSRLDHLKELGINAIQLMPIAEFAGDVSWGYNPAHIFAIESAYGGPAGLKRLVKAAHEAGIAVIIDVVYNHFGPSDLQLWQFDGWHENNKGGIYFYNDDRAATPWGESRPDYGRGEVRQFIRDNALMWLDEYHADGLRYDMTLYIRTIDGGTELPEGWGLAQWINEEVARLHPGKITIAEDLQNNAFLTKTVADGGAGFGSQWDAGFVHPVRSVLTCVQDEERSMAAICDALKHKYNIDAFERVVYTESHDEVANGKARLPHEVAGHDNANWFARKRSMLGACLVMTAPGIPMLFQGQEFLQGEWFQDTQMLDWGRIDEHPGVLQMYRDAVALRRNQHGHTTGLTGQHIHVYHGHELEKVVAFHRSKDGGPGDDVVVVANFSSQPRIDYQIGLPTGGTWKLRLSSDWKKYGDDFDDMGRPELVAEETDYDELPFKATLDVGPYSLVVYSQDRVG